MKRVLIIVYYWPPTGGSGVQRWVKFAKHLRSFGWEPVIFTPDKPFVTERDESLLKDIPNDIEVIRHPVFEISKYFGGAPTAPTSSAQAKPSLFSKIKKTVGNYVRGNYFIPDPRILWLRPSVKFLTTYLQQKPVDAIVSSGPPHSLHLIAKQLKEKTGTPWVADFRDPWLEILNFHGFGTSPSVIAKHTALFKGVINTADATIAAHPSVQQSFQQQTKQPVHLITNGYDIADIQATTPAQVDSSKFNMVFVGIFYGILNSTPFWQAVKELLDENETFRKQLKITFVGKAQQEVMNDLQQYQLLPYCEFTGYVNHNIAVGYEKAADVLLLFTPSKPEFRYVIPGKIFEYMAVQKPVLCIAETDNDSAQIIKQANAGTIVSPDNKNAIKAAIIKLYQAYQSGTVSLASSGYEKYERKAQTEVLASILNQLKK